MGAKYSSQSASGYNSSPPPDDGSVTAANKITWSGIKTKLADAIKTLADGINTQLVNAFDYAATSTSVTYTTVAGDHEKLIEATGTITISLGDATTMGAGYRAGVYNKGTAVVTVGLATAGNTLNGSAAGTVKLLPGQTMWFVINQAITGYDIHGSAGRQVIILTGSAGTNTVTAACDSLLTGLSAGHLFLLIPAGANTGATTLNITPSGGSALTAKNVFLNNAALTGGELQTSVPVWMEYDGTQFQIIAPSFANQAANKVYAGPSSGSAAQPVFRSLAAADVVGLGLNASTSQATTSGTSIDFTAPAAVTAPKRVTICLAGVSTNGTDFYQIQIGPSGGVVASGYLGGSSTLGAGTATSNFTAGFGIRLSDATNPLHGSITLTLENASSNTWVASGITGQSGAAQTITTAGSIALSGVLNKLRLTTSGGVNTFDAGEMNVIWE